MTKLSVIAAQMRRDIDTRPYGLRKLPFPGGLDVTLSHIDDRYRLSICREREFPSTAETELLMAIFGVADGTEATPSEVTLVHPETHRVIVRKTIEYRWTDAPPTVRLPRWHATNYPLSD